jgi:hypothetical protein
MSVAIGMNPLPVPVLGELSGPTLSVGVKACGILKKGG